MLALTSVRGATAIVLLAACLGIAIIGGGFTPAAGAPAAPATSDQSAAETAPMTAAISPATPVVTVPPTPVPQAGNRPGRQGSPGGPGLQPRVRQTRPAAQSPLAIYFGLSDFQLQTQLAQGQTLAEIAQAQGKSTADLKSFLMNQIKAQYDQAVATGRISNQQEDTLLARASGQLDQLITANLASQVTDQEGGTSSDNEGPPRGPNGGFSDDDGQ